MEPEFWRQTWAASQIGFHEGKVNQHLARFADRLAGTRVLVPLCGKAEDLAYLASRGHEVLGVELVEDAVAAFFVEHGLTPIVNEPWTPSTHRVYRAGSITLIAGDWFTVTREMVGAIDAVYDRAAMVALPAEIRPRYVTQLKSLVDADTPGLLIALEYPQDRFQGPPFPIPDAEVRATFASAELLAETLAVGGRLAAANMGAIERAYALRI